MATTELGPGGFPIATAPAVPAVTIAQPITRLGAGGFPVAVIAPVNIAALGDLVSTAISLIAGTASGQTVPIHIVVSGAAHQPRKPIVINAEAKGRILRLRTRLLPGSATATITTLQFLKSGTASGDAATLLKVSIGSSLEIIEGKAFGERYVSEDEMILMIAEAA